MTVNELADQVKANSAATNAQIAKLQLMLEALMKTRNEDQLMLEALMKTRNEDQE